MDYYAKKALRGEEIDDEVVAESFLEYAELAPRSDEEKMAVATRVVHVLLKNVKEEALRGLEGRVILNRQNERRHREGLRRFDHLESKIDDLKTEINYEQHGGYPQLLHELSEALPEEHDLRFLEEKELIDLLSEFPWLLQRLRESQAESETQKSDAHRTLPLPYQERVALGIVAASPIPPALEWLEDLFPERDWTLDVDSLAEKDLLHWGDHQRLELPESVHERVLGTDEARNRFDKAWLDALKPYQHHPDVAAFLALKYVRRDQYSDAVRVLVNSAYAVEPGSANDLICSVLKPLLESVEPEDVKGLSPQEIVRAYNALGMSLSRRGDQEQALNWFEKLRSYSRTVGDDWGIGQSHINAGVALFRSGDESGAAKRYEKAEKHAREHEDDELLSRALHNLASLKVETDPKEALRLLEESQNLKEKTGDAPGLLGSKMTRGIIAVNSGNFNEAERLFREAVEKAGNLDRRYLKALALCNLGSTLVDEDRPSEAVSYYTEARALSEEEGLRYPLRLALRGEALAYINMGAYERAEPLFSELAALEGEIGHEQETVIALHDQGVCLTETGQPEDARQCFRRSLSKARETGLSEWIYRAQLSHSLTYRQDNPQLAVSKLAEAARSESDRENQIIAGRLWLGAAEEAIRQRIGGQTFDSADDSPAEYFVKGIEAFSEAENLDALAEAYERLYDWYRRQGDFPQALEVLNEARSEIPDSHPDTPGFEDERGVCLQHLGRFDEAEEAHSKSLEMSRTQDDGRGKETSLNNLGELYRKTGRPKKAIDSYQEAEKLASHRGDEEGRLSVAHNRALALNDLGSPDEARSLMEQIKREAQEIGSTYQLARALHGEALLAWQEEPDRETISTFKTAMDRARELGEMEPAVSAAANYASLLFQFDEAEKAVRELQPLESKIEDIGPLREYDYFSSLAEAYERVGDLQAARDCWLRALRIGKQIGNPETIQTPLMSLAGLDEQIGWTEEAEEKIDEALGYVSGIQEEGRILLAHLENVCRIGNESRVDFWGERVQELADNQDLDHIYTDLHLQMGRYYLSMNHRRCFEAGQHFTAALSRGGLVEEDVSRMVEVGVDILFSLTTLEMENQSTHLEQLIGQLEDWLIDEAEEITEPERAKYLLWPFKAAYRLAEETGDLSELGPKQIEEIAGREIDRLLPDKK
ncbi:tetratricopeptide repeat protein [Salinibacter sp.]|uniref:tetratricopeptide repeat protein n=1 Tax=Salinibacter sp. TaxID=2065818 RepID=UPI0021E75688|nr:tetratricopeptide repeat protein [Salinibacter sp.]